MERIEKIYSVDRLVKLAQQLKVRDDWHEPDEQGITVTVKGNKFDNAGYWGNQVLTKSWSEKYVTIKKDNKPIAEINLATLFAFACRTYEG